MRNSKEYYKTHKKEMYANASKYRNKNREKWNEYMKTYWQDVRKKFFEMYGNKCSCCGETELKFLSLDHVQNNGNDLRKKNGKGFGEYVTATKKYGPETYQVLCFNCNLGKNRNNGKCPHKDIHI
jgi:hypothetical protein